MQFLDDQIKNLFSIGSEFFFRGIGLMQSWDDQIKNLFSDWLFFMVWDQCNLGTIKSKTCFLIDYFSWYGTNAILGRSNQKLVFNWDWLSFRVWDQCNLGTVKSKIYFLLGLTFFGLVGVWCFIEKGKKKCSFFGYLLSIQMSQPFNQAKVRVVVLINQNTSAIN